jgi:putative transcriptional regulator
MIGDMSGAAPILLLSMPQMADPNFAQTVVLLCQYTHQGAFGIVVNRQMDEPAWTMVQTEPPIKVDPEVRLWVGGPVEPQHTWVLTADPLGPEDERSEIYPGVVLSASHQLTLQILQDPPSTRARVVVGYAGWGAGQLDQELAASAWLTMDVDSGLIFGVPPELMWATALRRLGTNPAKLQTSFGVH